MHRGHTKKVGLYKNGKLGLRTPEKPENQDPVTQWESFGTLQNPENRDPEPLFLHTLFQFCLTIAPVQNTGLINAKYNNALHGTVIIWYTK